MTSPLILKALATSSQPKRLLVHVKTRQPKTKILGERDGAIQIALHAPPEDNKANVELIKFLTKETGRRARIVMGRTSKEKTVNFD